VWRRIAGAGRIGVYVCVCIAGLFHEGTGGHERCEAMFLKRDKKERRN